MRRRGGGYLVRSVYFDDWDDSCLRANEEGTSPREKWRIRAYDCDRSFVRLERKRKERGMTSKASCRLEAAEAERLLRGQAATIGATNDPLLNRLAYEQRARLLHPVVVVSYRRVPFVCPQGNVRVTFDLDIASSPDVTGLFEPCLAQRPVMPSGMQLLEVKYDEYIPDHVYHAIQMTNMQQATFSKYCLCRRFAMRGAHAA